MNVFQLDGHTVNSSFDREYTENMLRSFLAMAQAFNQPGFETMNEDEQKDILNYFYEKPIPSPDTDKEQDFKLKDPIMFQSETDEKIVINAVGGQWYVLLERDLLSFNPPEIP